MSEVEQKVTAPTVPPTTTADPLARLPLDQPWLGSLLRPALIAVMIICLDVALLSLVSRVSPTLAGAYSQVVLVLGLVATLLGCVTTSWLAQPAYRHLRRPIYRLAEFLFLLVFTRLLLWLLFGGLPTLTALIYRPLAALFDGPYIVATLIIVLSWFFAGELTSELLRLALQPDELFALAEDRIGELVRTSNSDRPAVLQRFVANWVAGGIVMVLIAASVRLARPENGFFAITRQNIDPTVITVIILYFLAGLLLISQGQLALLRTRWLIDRVPASDTVLRNWPIYVFALLLAVALVATLLPFGGTFLLAQLLYTAVTFIFNFFFEIFRFFMGLFLLLVALLTGDSPPPPPAATPPPPPPALEALPQAASPLPAWTGGMIFWIVMAIFLSYAAYIYLSDKGVQFTWLRTFWQLLRARWALLTGAYQQWQQTRIHGPQPEAAAADQRSGWFKFGGQRGWQHLDPTQRVRYFYLKTLEQAQTKGLGRKGDETPARYAVRLATPFAEQPEHAQAVEELTTAFIQARYTTKPLQSAQAQHLETLWQKFRTFWAEQS